MTWVQAVLVFGVCWWLLLFMALPVGIRPEENPLPGQSHAAPANPNLGKKFAVVTVLAALVTWGIDLIVHSGIVTVHF